MDIVDYGNSAYDDDFKYECNVCGKSIQKKGVCSLKCHDIDMR